VILSSEANDAAFACSGSCFCLIAAATGRTVTPPMVEFIETTLEVVGAIVRRIVNLSRIIWDKLGR
jgi:hypothetical protein